MLLRKSENVRELNNFKPGKTWKSQDISEFQMCYSAPTLSYVQSKIPNPLSANPTKCLNTLKQLVGNLPTNCLSVFDHFVRLTLKGLI